MGVSASIQTTVDTTINRIKHELVNTANATAATTCTITIGDITVTDSVSCGITVKNLCSADASASLTAVQTAIQNTLQEATEADKANVADWFHITYGVLTTASTVSTDVSNYISNACTTSAVTNNSIDIKNIHISGCQGPFNFEYVNTGHAIANCGINIVMNTAVTAANKTNQVLTTGIDPILFVFGAVAIVGLIILYYVLSSWFAQKSKLTGNDLVRIAETNPNSYAVNLAVLKNYDIVKWA